MAQYSEKMSHPLAGKHIIVAGAGLAGLAFVRGLNRYWPQGVEPPSIAVYERDPRELPAVRGNYSLGLRSDSGGLQALQKLGLIDEVFNHRTPGTEVNYLILRDAKWNKLFQPKPSSAPPDGLPAAYMRITRSGIRDCLLQGAENDADMHWELSCISARRMEDDRVEVTLSNGSTETCDLLIVADGASSKLRKCLRPGDDLNFAGVVLIGGNAHFSSPENIPDRLKEGYGPVIGGDGHILFVFQIDPSSYVWFISRRTTTPRTPVQGSDAAAMKDDIIKEALSEGKVFTEPFPTLLAATDPYSLRIINARDKPPIEHSQTPHLPSVIFIGDANHAVSPFAGNGANMAIIDGQSLGQSLCNSPSVASAVTAFDKESIPRCKKPLKISHLTIWVFHSTGWTLWCFLLLLKMLKFFVR